MIMDSFSLQKFLQASLM